MNYYQVYGFDCLYDSMKKCIKGVGWKNEPSKFLLNGLEYTLKLEDDFFNHVYKASKVKKFTLLYPKNRDVVATTFRDRIPQRSLNDNILYPTMTKSFVPSNFACQKNKGTDAARDYFMYALRKECVKFKNNFYVAKLDIKGYYKNIRHDKTNAFLYRKLQSWEYEETVKVLERQYEGPMGYNPGSQMVQIVGISFLDCIDHFIKEKLRVKLYERYMDDLILISEDKKYLEYCLQEIQKELVKLGLEAHPKKTKIYDMSKEKVNFLGFDYKITPTGKVIMNIVKSNVKHYKKKLRRLVGLAKKGRKTRQEVDECYAAWKAHAAKGRSFKLFRMMDKYYKDLWRYDNDYFSSETKYVDRGTKRA